MGGGANGGVGGATVRGGMMGGGTPGRIVVCARAGTAAKSTSAMTSLPERCTTTRSGGKPRAVSAPPQEARPLQEIAARKGWGTMMRLALAPLCFALAGTLCASSARAQEMPDWFKRRPQLPAPNNTFEFKVGTGYAQGFGGLAPGQSVGSAAGPGIALSADLDHRMTPQTSVGLETQYQQFAAENAYASRGLALNVGATAHATPEQRWDGWVRFGMGYRMLWEVNPTLQPNVTNMFHGFDLANVKVGYDLRVSKNAAFSPVLGVDLQLFLWENNSAMSSAEVATFLYAGLQGRFDDPSSTGLDLAAKR